MFSFMCSALERVVGLVDRLFTSAPSTLPEVTSGNPISGVEDTPNRDFEFGSIQADSSESGTKLNHEVRQSLLMPKSTPLSGKAKKNLCFPKDTRQTFSREFSHVLNYSTPPKRRRIFDSPVARPAKIVRIVQPTVRGRSTEYAPETPWPVPSTPSLNLRELLPDFYGKWAEQEDLERELKMQGTMLSMMAFLERNKTHTTVPAVAFIDTTQTSLANSTTPLNPESGTQVQTAHSLGQSEYYEVTEVTAIPSRSSESAFGDFSNYTRSSPWTWPGMTVGNIEATTVSDPDEMAIDVEVIEEIQDICMSDTNITAQSCSSTFNSPELEKFATVPPWNWGGNLTTHAIELIKPGSTQGLPTDTSSINSETAMSIDEPDTILMTDANPATLNASISSGLLVSKFSSIPTYIPAAPEELMKDYPGQEVNSSSSEPIDSGRKKTSHPKAEPSTGMIPVIEATAKTPSEVMERVSSDATAAYSDPCALYTVATQPPLKSPSLAGCNLNSFSPINKPTNVHAPLQVFNTNAVNSAIASPSTVSHTANSSPKTASELIEELGQTLAEVEQGLKEKDKKTFDDYRDIEQPPVPVFTEEMQREMLQLLESVRGIPEPECDEEDF